MNCNAIFFDVAFTLLYPHPSVGSVYAGEAAHFGVHIDPSRLDSAFGPAWKQAREDSAGLPYGPTDEDARRFWRTVVNDSFRRAGSHMPEDPYFDRVFDRFASRDCWRLFDDVIPALDRCREAGVVTGILSNFDSRLRPLLDSLNILHYMDHVIISCEAGVEKPEPQIYYLAQEIANIPSPQNCAMIGDQEKEDLDGARSAGWQSVLIDRKSEPSLPKRFDSLVKAVEYLLR